MGCAALGGELDPAQQDSAAAELVPWLKRGLTVLKDVEDGFHRDGTILAFATEGEVLRLPTNGAIAEVVHAVYCDALDGDGGVDVTAVIQRRLQPAGATGVLELQVSAAGLQSHVAYTNGALRVTYRPSVVPAFVEAADQRQLLLSAEAVEGIVEAKYGAGELWADVRSIVVRQILEGRSVTVRPESFGVDPLPGSPKTLRVRYLPKHYLQYKVDMPSQPESAIHLEPLTPWFFKEIRDLSGLDHKQYLSVRGALNAAGRVLSRSSGSTLYYTSGDEYIIKTVSNSEMMALVCMMPDYIQHLRQHAKSFLPRYVNAFRMRRPDGARINVVTMLSAFATCPSVDYVFDLKGFAEGHGVGVDISKNTILNDANFQLVTLHLEDAETEAFARTLKADSLFLESQDCIDYSLLLGVVYPVKAKSAASFGGHRPTNATIRSAALAVAGAGVGRPSRGAPCAPLAQVGGRKASGMARSSVATISGFNLQAVQRFEHVNDMTGVGQHAIQSTGVFAGSSTEVRVLFGFGDTLVMHGIRRPKLRGVNAEATTPAAYASNFREYFALRVRSIGEHLCVTPVQPDIMTPLALLPTAGYSSSFFKVCFKAAAQDAEAMVSPEYWIAKLFGRTNDEVLFYEAAKVLKHRPTWELLKWALYYGGVCRVLAHRKEGRPPEMVDVMLLRNVADGYESCRLLDIKIGDKTAVAGWKGKSVWKAWRQNAQDAITNGGNKGFRLDGFQNRPQVLESYEELGRMKIAGMVDKSLMRMHMNRMTATDFLPYFFDLHSIAGGAVPAGKTKDPSILTSVEHQELVLLTCIEELSAYVAACRKVPVPQMWIGSSIMLAFDCRAKVPRQFLSRNSSKPGDVARMHIFDWGRSELNTPKNHANLTPKSQAQRQAHWDSYCAGVAKLLFECCSLYFSRFWHTPKCFSLAVWDKDTYSQDDFIGYCAVPVSVMYERLETIRDHAGHPVKRGAFSAKDATIEFTISKTLTIPPDSRMECPWVVRVEKAAHLPRMDYMSEADSYVEVKAHPECEKTIRDALKEKTAGQVRRLLHDHSHPSCLHIDTSQPFWGEEFQFATLKQEARVDFLRALSIALDVSTGEKEAERFFTGPRDERGREFAQRCFPDVRVADDHSSRIMQSFPEDDALRLIHVGEWMVRAGHSKDLVFVMFFLACVRIDLERARDILGNFCESFWNVQPTRNWVTEVRHCIQALQKPSEKTCRDTKKVLLKVARVEMQMHWLTYTLQRMGETDFSEWKGTPAEAKKIKAAGMKSVCIVPEGLLQDPKDKPLNKKRWKAGGGITERASMLVSECESPAKRVAAATRIITLALHMEDLAMRRLVAACDGALDDELKFRGTEKAMKRRCFKVPAGGCKYAASPGKDTMVFEAFAPEVFADFRRRVCEITDDELLAELANAAQPLQSVATNSKSGELFLRSATGRFIVKTVSHAEAATLIAMLPKYILHHEGETPSLLGKYLGLYSLSMGAGKADRYLAVMRSVFDTPQPLIATYDLKGCAYRREANALEAVRKDQDWIADGRHLDLSDSNASSLLAAHRRDCDFLASYKVFDYSLLVGIAHSDALASVGKGAWTSQDKRACFFVGIIDFLVKYGEHELRGYTEEELRTTPAEYADGQRRFLERHILGQVNER